MFIIFALLSVYCSLRVHFLINIQLYFLDQASPEQVTLFLMEGSHLKKSTHHNVLSLMHCCFEDQKLPLVIYPYMNRGNLKNYLRLSRTAEPLAKVSTVSTGTF